MATLNEQEQHIFETLLNQTDAVSPGVDKSQHQEHARDFHDTDSDFQFLDKLINSGIGEDIESMTSFSHQSSKNAYGVQGLNNPFQSDGLLHDNQQSTTDSTFPNNSSAGYHGQQAQYSEIEALQSQTHMEHSPVENFELQGHSYQQFQGVTSPQAQLSINIEGSENYQNPGTELQQQYHTSSTASASQLVQPNSVQVNFPNPASSFPQHYHVENSALGSGDLAGSENSSYQSQESTFLQKSLQSEDPLRQTKEITQSSHYFQNQIPLTSEGISSSVNNDQGSLATDSCHSQTVDYQQHQPLQSELTSANNTKSISNEDHTSKFQQHSGYIHLSVADFQKQMTNYQSQQQTVMYQQCASQSNHSMDHSFQGNPNAGITTHYSNSSSVFSQQQSTTESHQEMISASNSGQNSNDQQSLGFAEQLHKQLQNAEQAPEQMDQNTHLGQPGNFQVQNSFQSPSLEPLQQTQVDHSNPSTFYKQSSVFNSQQFQLANQSSSSPSDQNVRGDFQVQSSAFGQNAPTPSQSNGGSFHTQMQGFVVQTSIQDQNCIGNLQSKTSGLSQSLFPLSSSSLEETNHMPMQESSVENSSVREESSNFSQENLQRHTSFSLCKDQKMQEHATEHNFQCNQAFDEISSHVQQDQPMETQQSPFFIGASSTTVFQTQGSALTQQSIFQSSNQTSQAPEAGNGNKSSPWEQHAKYHTALLTPISPLSSQITQQSSSDIHTVSTGGSQGLGLDENGSACFPSKSSVNSVTQSLQTSGHAEGNRPFFLTTSDLNNLNQQTDAGSQQEDLLRQTIDNAANFEQFQHDNLVSFSKVTAQQQQPNKEQSLPFTFIQPHEGGFPSSQQTNSFGTSATGSEQDAQNLLFGVVGSSNSQNSASQCPQVKIVDSQQLGINLNSGNLQQSGSNTPGQNGLTQPACSSGIPSATFPMGSPNHGSQSQAPGQLSTNIGLEKSQLSALFDSSQANAALNLLASVVLNQNLLQQLQTVLPQLAAGHLHRSSAVAGSSLDPMQPLLQHEKQNKFQQGTQNLQQQQQSSQSQQQQVNSVSGQQLIPGQGFHILQPQAVSAAQQLNFIMQQPALQPSVFVEQQHQLNQQLSQPHDNTSTQFQLQQQAVHIPVSIASSSENSGGSIGLTLGRDGQLMMGQQAVRILLQSDTSTANTVTHSAGGSSTTTVPYTTAAFTGGSRIPQQIVVPTMVGLPSSLKNVGTHPFSSVVNTLPSVTSGDHTVPSTSCPAPETDSSIIFSSTSQSFLSLNSSHPVTDMIIGETPEATNSNDLNHGIQNTSSGFNLFPTSNQDFLVGQNVQKSGSNLVSSAGISNIANIFYPASSPCQKNPMDTTQSQTHASPSVGNFLNVTAGSASMSLLNAYKMAVADGNAKDSGYKLGEFSSSPCAGSLFHDMAKPMETNQNAAKMDTSEMDIIEGDSKLTSLSCLNSMETERSSLAVSSHQSSRRSSVEEAGGDRGDANSMLRRILTMKDEDLNVPMPSADPQRESPTPHSSPVYDLESPGVLFTDNNTQSTLIEKSEKLHLSADPQQDEIPNDFWSSVSAFPTTPCAEVVPSKVHRGVDDLDASSAHVSVPSVEKLFDAGGASSSSFVFAKFGTDEPGVFTFGNNSLKSNAGSTTVKDTKMTNIASISKQPDSAKLSPLPISSIRSSSRKQKDPTLTAQFPSKTANYELRIISQPEEQHRARYLTEGSRGAVKDRSQQGYPIIKLLGYNEPATLQIFIGSEIGRIKPHGFYQACKVWGKNSTPCTEREIEGTNVIEIEISPMNDMQVNMDCVGILKLRNADVEKRIGPAKAKAKKKNSTKARLVFRVTLRKPDGMPVTLQTASTPILCTQPVGQPEISRMSLSEMHVNQTSDLFIIGKNFLKGTCVVFQEWGPDERDIIWQSDAEIDAEHFQQTHLICKIPEYPRKDIQQSVHVQIVVKSGGKSSDPQDFTYKPALMVVRQQDSMETEPSAQAKALPFGVSPVALQLNRLMEHSQHHATSSAVFQLPPGTVPSILSSHLPSNLVSSGATTPLTSVLKPPVFTLPGASSGSQSMVTSTPSFMQSSIAAGVDRSNSLGMQFVVSSVAPVQSMNQPNLGTLGSQKPHFLMMSPSAPTSVAHNNTSHSVFSLGSLPSITSNPKGNSIASSTATVNGFSGGGGSLSAVLGQPQGSLPITTSPMIVILTGPPNSSAAITAASPNTSQMAHNQLSNNRQVESLLKQMLEVSKPRSS